MKAFSKALVIGLGLTSALACSRPEIQPAASLNAIPKIKLPDAPVLSERLAFSGLALCDDENCGTGTPSTNTPNTSTPSTSGSAGGTTSAPNTSATTATTATGIPTGAVSAPNGYWAATKDNSLDGMMRYYEKGSNGYTATNWYGGFGTYNSDKSDFVKDTTNQKFTMMKGNYDDKLNMINLNEKQQFSTQLQSNGNWSGQMVGADGKPYAYTGNNGAQVTNSTAVYNPQSGWTYGFNSDIQGQTYQVQTPYYNPISALQAGQLQVGNPGGAFVPYTSTMAANPMIILMQAMMQQ